MITLVQIGLIVMLTAQLGRIPVLSTGAKEAPILVNDFFVIGIVVSGLLLAVRRKALRIDRPASYALAFAAIGAGSALLAVPRFGLSSFEFLFSTAYLARWLTYFGLYLTCINFIRYGDVRTVMKTLVGVVLAFAAFGIIQSIFLPGFAQIVYPESELYTDWDPQGHRLVSTFLDPNFAGIFIVIGLLLLLAQLAYGVPVARWKLLLLFTALVLTLSRSSVLGFLAGGLVILAVKGRSSRLWRFAGLLTLLTLPALPFILQYAASFNKLTIDGSALTRVLSWVAAIEIFLDNPIFGVGFNTYGFVQREYGGAITGQASFGLDGGLIFVAVMTGIVGLTIYSSMFGSVFVQARRVWRNIDAPGFDRALCLGCVAASVALIIHSVFLNSLLYPFLMEPLWIIWAMTTITARANPSLRPARTAVRFAAGTVPERI